MDVKVRAKKIELAAVIINTFHAEYQNRKLTLSRIQKELYIGALRTGARELCGRDAAGIIAEYDAELADQRARAEAARLARPLLATEGR